VDGLAEKFLPDPIFPDAGGVGTLRRIDVSSRRNGTKLSTALVALVVLSASAGCAGRRTASLATCALAGAGVGVVAGSVYGGLEGGGFETRDSAVGAFIGAGGGAVIGALFCALIPDQADAPSTAPSREPPVAPLPEPIDSRQELR